MSTTTGDWRPGPVEATRWSRGRLILLLRLSQVIAVSGLLLAQGLTPRLSSPTSWLILAVLASNLPLLWMPRRWIESERFGAVLIIVDTAWITAILSSAAPDLGVDFYLFYFSVLFLAAVSESLALLGLGTALVCGAYLYTVVIAQGAAAVWSPGHLVRLPFFMAVAALYGFLLQRVRQQRQAERSLRTKDVDLMTGLANRRVLEERLEGAVSHALRTGRRVALLVFDVDSFRLINVTYGEEVGNAVLIEIANRLRRHVRAADALGRFQPGDFGVPSRLGGDEFALVLTEVTDLVGVATAVQRLCRVVEEPMLVGDTRLVVRTTVGIAVYPDEGEFPERGDVGQIRRDLLIQADRALYSAQQEGEGFQFHDPEMDGRIGKRLAVGQALSGVLDRDELYLDYQPQVDLARRCVTGVEALLRWRHPTRGLVGPLEFIPIMERTGQIKEVGEWVLLTACRETKRWSGPLGKDISLAVNVSPVQFRDPVAVARLLRIIEAEGVATSLIDFEITESVLLEATSEVRESLARLHDRVGVRLTLDDFGRGYSSLEYLRRFPIDTVKVDRSFVGSMEDDADSAAIVSAILALAGRLHLRAIAEGVETEAQLRLLEREGCECAQGYYFSRPVPPDRVLRLLTEGSPRIRAAVDQSASA